LGNAVDLMLQMSIESSELILLWLTYIFKIIVCSMCVLVQEKIFHFQ